MKQTLNEVQAMTVSGNKEVNPNIVRYYNAWTEDNKLYVVVRLGFIHSPYKLCIDGTMLSQSQRI